MKNIFNIIAFLLIVVLSKAQSIDDTMSAAEVNTQLLSDLHRRYPETKKEVIVWDNSVSGYDALYTINNNNFLTHYDKKGIYIETRIEKEWNNEVPATVRNSYEKNFNKKYMVNGYWEVNDPTRKGYYLELKNENGQIKKIWMDNEGKVFDLTVSK